MVDGTYSSVTISKQLAIVGSTVGNRKDVQETLETARRGVVKARISVQEMCRLDNVFSNLHAKILQGRAVIKIQDPSGPPSMSLTPRGSGRGYSVSSISEKASDEMLV